jgi:hypothetical protein
MLGFPAGAILLGVLCSLTCLCSLASAQASAAPTTAPSGQSAPDAPIVVPKGLWTFETYGSFATQPRVREQLYSGTFGIGYTFMDNNSLTAEATGLEGTQAGPDVIAGGFDLLLRTDLINKRNLSLFIDFGAGGLQASRRIPELGTDYNFWFKTGVGTTIHLWDKTSLLTGVRYLHISNAHLEGPDRNPSLNATEGYLGLIVEF